MDLLHPTSNFIHKQLPTLHVI